MQLPMALRASQQSGQDGFKILFRVLGLNLIIRGLASLRHVTVGKGTESQPRSPSAKVELQLCFEHSSTLFP